MDFHLLCVALLYDATAVKSAEEAANCYKKCFFLYGIFRREIGRKIPAYIIMLEYLTSFAVVFLRTKLFKISSALGKQQEKKYSPLSL